MSDATSYHFALNRIAELETRLAVAERDRADMLAQAASAAGLRDLANRRAANLEECRRQDHAHNEAAWTRTRVAEQEREALLSKAVADCDAVLAGLKNGGARNAVAAVRALIVSRLKASAPVQTEVVRG